MQLHLKLSTTCMLSKIYTDFQLFNFSIIQFFLLFFSSLQGQDASCIISFILHEIVTKDMYIDFFALIQGSKKKKSGAS